MSHVVSRISLAVAAVAVLSALALPAQANDDRTAGSQPKAQAVMSSGSALPTLVVTQEPPPEVIYRRGSRDTILTDEVAADMRTPANQPVETLVTRKANELSRDLSTLQSMSGDYQSRLRGLQSKCDDLAAKYYEIVAGISTELQGGTTAGNPILIDRWNTAKDRLDALANTATGFNGLAADLNDAASKASFLQENIRAAYDLSGAVKEDHVRLRKIEDDLNQTIVGLNRLITTTSGEINRRTSYQRTESLNMQTLSLAIANGELYGKNITNTLYKNVADSGVPAAPGAVASIDSDMRKPLVIIRFDKPNISYQQALYQAIDRTLEKFPNAAFDVVAVAAAQGGNAAQNALATADSRKYGQDVLQSLTQMGLPLERVKLTTAASTGIRSNEVRIFLQ